MYIYLRKKKQKREKKGLVFMFLVMYYEKCKQEFRIIGEMLDKTEKEKKSIYIYQLYMISEIVWDMIKLSI